MFSMFKLFESEKGTQVMISSEMVKARFGFDPDRDGRVIRTISGLNSAQFFSKIRNLKYIERLAGRNTQRGINVAEHSFFVMNIFWSLCIEEEVTVSAAELITVGRHDFLEVISGDLVNLAKSQNSRTREAWKTIEDELASRHTDFLPYTVEGLQRTLGEIKYNLLVAADLLELWSFIMEDIFEFGNTSPNIISVKEDLDPVLENSEFEAVVSFKHQYEAVLTGGSNEQ